MQTDEERAPDRRAGRIGLAALVGPGLIVAATGIGSGDVVAATVAGANYGVALLWAVVVGAFFKFVLTEGIARWQLATGTTVIEGWVIHLHPLVRIYFGLYLLLWTIAVTAALTNATGLGIANLTGGWISQPVGAVLHSLVGCAFVLAGGFGWFEKVMKTLVGVMGFGVLACAILALDDPAAAARGLLVPRIPAGAGFYVMSVIGGIGGTLSILAYNYWMREEGIAGAAYLRFVRADLAVAYGFTTLFGIAVMLTAHQAFFLEGRTISDAEAISRMARTLGETLGPFGFYAYGVGFWAAVFASLLGVWQSLPYLFADYYGCVRGYPEATRREMTRVSSAHYRIALGFVTLAPLPFAFVGRPLFIIIAYTIIGSLFVPFLAATLLYLGNRVGWRSSVPHNHPLLNTALLVVLALFLVLGVRETLEVF